MESPVQNVDATELLQTAQHATQQLKKFSDDLKTINIESYEGLQQHTQNLRKLLETGKIWQEFCLQFNSLVHNEKTSIAESLQKKKEGLAQLEKSLTAPTPRAASANDTEKRTDNIAAVPASPAEASNWANVVSRTPAKIGPPPGILVRPSAPAESAKVPPRSLVRENEEDAIVLTPSRLVSKASTSSNGEDDDALPTELTAARGTRVGEKLIQHQIAHGVKIQAYVIDSPQQCHNRLGWWCYCPATERYHLSVNGEIFSAITTVIRPASDTPLKFIEHKSCHNRTSCDIDYETVDFYVPRELNPLSRDRRQLTNRMHFVPASQHLKPNEKYVYRIGSSATLEADLAAMQDADYRLLIDIAGNFLLSWTAAAKEIRRRRTKSAI
jgi:hypothetical protein